MQAARRCCQPPACSSAPSRAPDPPRCTASGCSEGPTEGAGHVSPHKLTEDSARPRLDRRRRRSTPYTRAPAPRPHLNGSRGSLSSCCTMLLRSTTVPAGGGGEGKREDKNRGGSRCKLEIGRRRQRATASGTRERGPAGRSRQWQARQLSRGAPEGRRTGSRMSAPSSGSSYSSAVQAVHAVQSASASSRRRRRGRSLGGGGRGAVGPAQIRRQEAARGACIRVNSPTAPCLTGHVLKFLLLRLGHGLRRRGMEGGMEGGAWRVRAGEAASG